MLQALFCLCRLLASKNRIKGQSCLSLSLSLSLSVSVSVSLSLSLDLSLSTSSLPPSLPRCMGPSTMPSSNGSQQEQRGPAPCEVEHELVEAPLKKVNVPLSARARELVHAPACPRMHGLFVGREVKGIRLVGLLCYCCVVLGRGAG